MGLKYKVKQMDSKQSEIFDELKNDGVSNTLAYLLALRDYTISNKLLDYNGLYDIDIATKYLFNAILNNKKMCVVADYDVDGATSCAIMYNGIKGLGGNIKYFVPNRFKHGYGLQASVIDDMLLKYKDIEVIITVDNGIASISGVDYANELGIDVVVTDHHLEGSELPNAICVVNPNQKKCTFKSKALAGCGVAFYLIQSLRMYFVNEYKNNIKNYNEENIEKLIKAINFKVSTLIDYVAIGTVSDLVPLDENNRLLVKTGINAIKKNKMNIGVSALIKALGIDNKKLNTSNIAFKIGPTLNAAGRIEDMGKGIDLLLSNNYEDAYSLALELIEINQKRKSIEKSMKETALKEVEETFALIENPNMDDKSMFSFCIYNKGFHEGVIGIVGSRIKDIMYLPTIIFAESEDGQLKGSGRSIEGLHLRDAIDYVFKTSPNTVIKFGGHSMAAGLTIYKDKFEDFKKHLNDYCREIFNDVKPTRINEVDLDLELSDINVKVVEEINDQIWGQCFPEPTFYGTFNVISQTVLKDAHLKLVLEKNGMEIEAMHFFNNKPFKTNKIEAIFKLNVNEFRNNKKVQLFIEEAADIMCEDY